MKIWKIIGIVVYAAWAIVLVLVLKCQYERAHLPNPRHEVTLKEPLEFTPIASAVVDKKDVVVEGWQPAEDELPIEDPDWGSQELDHAFPSIRKEIVALKERVTALEEKRWYGREK